MNTAVATGSSINRKGEMGMHNVNAVNKQGHTPLMEAAKEGDAEGVKDLLRRGAELEAKSSKGKTALHYAAANGHLDVVNLLIASGADINARDKEWHTPLMLAAIYGCNHTVQTLILNGADVHAKTLAGNTAMIYAKNNDHPLAFALLQKAERAKQATA